MRWKARRSVRPLGRPSEEPLEARPGSAKATVVPAPALPGAPIEQRNVTGGSGFSWSESLTGPWLLMISIMRPYPAGTVISPEKAFFVTSSHLKIVGLPSLPLTKAIPRSKVPARDVARGYSAAKSIRAFPGKAVAGTSSAVEDHILTFPFASNGPEPASWTGFRGLFVSFAVIFITSGS